MQIIKRLTPNGKSKQLVLPKVWIESFERLHGPLTEVLLDVGDKIVITPVASKTAISSSGVPDTK
jgi:malonyl CoA-acyl carrier protein transacylase